MKMNSKNNKEKARQKALQAKSRKMKLTVGIDLGDEWSHCCFLGEDGEIVEECRVKTTREAVKSRFGELKTGGDCPRGRDAFALGESDAERVWARGDRGQCAGIASDHRKRPEE